MSDRLFSAAGWAAVTIAIFLAGGSPCPSARADTLWFKDGSKTVCRERAWEKDGMAHCEFYGITVSYPIQEVERIEPSQPTALTQVPETTPAGSASFPPPRAAENPVPDAGNPSTAFYDPRRPRRYWSSESVHHDSFREAVAALAAEFGRDPAWIEKNMGNSNNLAEIRGNLASTAGAPEQAPAPPLVVHETGDLKGIPFYDPRRPKKYWSDAHTHHETFAAALEALSARFGRPPQWIRSHMGESNDLGELHLRLSRAMAAEGGADSQPEDP